jgi:hypothetical protein
MKSLDTMSNYMIQIVASLMMAGFSYKEGQAMFRAMADIMAHIDDTNGLMPDALDAEILEARLKEYLK